MQKENRFRQKFRLLSSQEHSEEINWSSSESSGYENEVPLDKHILANKSFNHRKRKRKTPKNTSNLSITILDTSRNKQINNRQSPILCKKKVSENNKSPILIPTQTFKENPAKMTVKSPIIKTRSIVQKSPILAPKRGSPISALKMKKKLYNHGDYITKSLDMSQCEEDIKIEPLSCATTNTYAEDTCNMEQNNNNFIITRKPLENTSKAKIELINKVKSFFDNHFSSDSNSQNTISETSTPKESSRSEDIEVLSCSSMTNALSIKKENSTNSDNQESFQQKRKKYKKGGLADRLNRLIKKETSCHSLWQHEKYLAANSNFVIPKVEYSLFRIRNFENQYGCYLFNVVDENGDSFVIIISSNYIVKINECDTMIKVYKPFTLLKIDNFSVLLNVYKYDLIER